MKRMPLSHRSLLLVIPILLVSAGGVTFAQDETSAAIPEGAAAEEASPPPAVLSDEEVGEALRKLPQEKREELMAMLNEASQFVQGIRLQEALQRLLDAEALLNENDIPPIFQIYNLRGAAFTKMRDFDKARDAFEKAVALRANVFHPQFNLAELEFVTGEYEVAAKSFQRLLDEYPKIDVGTKRLLEYKLVICNLKLDRVEEAKKMLATFSYLDDTPAYYLGNAAMAFHKDDEEDAQSWIASSRKIYSAAQIEVFLDSLIEVGWIETL